MIKLKKKFIKNINGLNYFYLESGKINKIKSNVILFLHGFPELSYSYRYLLKNFSYEGYYCIAPDQRGYGKTSFTYPVKSNATDYSIFNLTKDIFHLLVKLKIRNINLVGHDFGSYVASYFCLFYPKFVKSLVLMSMPFGGIADEKALLKTIQADKNLRSLKPPRKHYQTYFAGKTANKNMMYCKQGVTNFLRAYYHFKSYDYYGNKPQKLKNFSAKELSKMPEYYIMKRNKGMAQTVNNYMPKQNQIKKCQWLTNSDLKVYSTHFKKNTFQGPLNWYKMMLNVKENKKIKDLKLSNFIDIPTIFISGKSDWGIYQKPGQLEDMKKFFKKFYGIFLIDKAGHWVQQEQPYKTFQAMNKFYKSIS